MQYKTSEVFRLDRVSATVQIMTDTIQFVREMVADLQAWYTFYDTVDTFEITGESPFISGNIKLYIDSEVYLQFDIQPSYGGGGSGDSAPTRITITIYFNNNTLQTFQPLYFYHAGWASSTAYMQYTVFKSNKNVFLSVDYRIDSTTYINSRNNGLRLILGTAHVINTDEDVPALYVVVPSGTSVFDNSITPSFLNQTIRPCLCCKASQSIIPSTVDFSVYKSNAATMSPCAGINQDVYMNNLLVATLIPDNFAAAFSMINYNNKRYFQIGRFMCLDE